MKTFTQLLSLSLLLVVGLWACQDQAVTPEAMEVQPEISMKKPPPDPEDPSITFEFSTGSAVTEGIAFNLQVIASGRKPGVPLNNFNKTVTLSSDGGITPTTVSFTKGVASVVATLGTDGHQVVTASGEGGFGEWVVDVAADFYVDGKIAFCSDRAGGSDIWLLKEDSPPEQLTFQQDDRECDQQYAYPSWSPDGSKVAFTSHDVNGKNQIYVVDVDTKVLTQVTDNPDQGSVFPSWSPDGSMIAYSLGFDNESEICVTNSDGEGPSIRLTTNGYRDKFPSWSPDGTQIIWSFDPAWAVSNDIGISVATLNFDPAYPGDLDHMHWVEERIIEYGYVQPSWSSTSDLVAVWGRDAGEWTCGEFFVMNPDGSGVRQLTWDWYCYDRPGTPRHQWDPDGERLAITRFLGDYDHSQIFLAPVDGSGATPLTDAPGNNQWGEWLPTAGGSTFVVFQSTRDGTGSLLAIDVDEMTETTLTDVLGNDGKPVVWVPSPPTG